MLYFKHALPSVDRACFSLRARRLKALNSGDKDRLIPCIDWQGKGFSFFSNTGCEYFPCHGTDTGDHNCLFCFCPLYAHADCGGTYVVLESGRKDCSGCDLPHRKENYGLVVEQLKEKAL